MRLILWIALFVASFCHAEEKPAPASDVIMLQAGLTHNGDYFAFGESVEISGEIFGDAYIMAGQVVVDGTIHGDLLVITGAADISGEVTKNIRLIGGQMLLSGKVGGNVSALAGNVQMLPSSSIGGNLVAVAGNVDLSASVGSDATVISSYLRMSGAVQNQIAAYVGNLRLTSKARVGGDLDYRSNHVALIEEGALVKGEILYRPSLVHELIEGTWVQKLLVGSKIIGFLMNFFYSLVVGIILIKLYPKNLEVAIHSLSEHPWKALGFGLVLLVLLPLASLILLMTILGVPFALTLIAANVIGFYTAKIYSIFGLSQWICHKLKLRFKRLSMLYMGLVVYFGLIAIPFVGILFSFAAMLFGLGAGVMAHTRRRTV